MAARDGGPSGPAVGSFTSPNAGEVAIELLPSEQRVYGSEELNLLWREATAPIPEAVEVDFARRQVVEDRSLPSATLIAVDPANRFTGVKDEDDAILLGDEPEHFGGGEGLTHPSLHAPFVPPADLVPQRKMQRNEPCWCGSGKKWKRCHRDRESQQPIEFGQQLHQMYGEFQKGYCSHPEASPDNCGRIVRAHTVQRRGGLTAIAENGHVVSAKTGFQNLSRSGTFLPSEVGVRSASTFMGFCDTHDNSMFKSVETVPVQLTPECCFLLGFRATSYELLQKRAALRSVSITRESDRGRPFEDQCAIQQHLHMFKEGTKRGVADLERRKRHYDRIFVTRQFEEYRCVGVSYSSVLPMVGCGAFMPEYDFAGNPLQRVSRGDVPHEGIDLNLTVLNGRTVHVIGWAEPANGPAASFGRSFRDVPDDQKADVAIQLAAEHIENIYIRPTWWRGLSGQCKNKLIERMHSGFALDRGPDCLRPDGHPYTTDVHVVEKVYL